MEQATPYTESTATSATAPSVTNANLIEMHTRYTQLPEAAQLAFLEVEQYINYQKSIFRSGGTGIDHNILHIKDQARELMQTTAILNTQLEEQNQTVTYLDIEVRQQMDATVIGKEWVGNGCAQRIFGAGNHHHYISRLYGRLQDQIEGFKLAIWHIEHHLHQQQEMTTQMLPWKLGAMITAQNDLLSSLSSQANKLHQLVQDMLLQVPINHL
ncbi:hypothetical protein BCR42DRAFT_426801 [Absidia repens]|uniref:Uncharacterized protein n=1 Tax=Absidia repens TaxID=90262 RepID=A0A1X2I0B6_9FUNG|nr:hypothetical protein BCR42DRAFT_426801 [Absidia repens]